MALIDSVHIPRDSARDPDWGRATPGLMEVPAYWTSSGPKTYAAMWFTYAPHVKIL